MTALIDNWSSPEQIEVLNPLLEFFADKPPQGYGDVDVLSLHHQFNSLCNREGYRSAHRMITQLQKETDINTLDILSCRSVPWHTDTKLTQVSILWILRNDGYSVEASSGPALLQSVGDVIVLDISRRHRCRSIAGRSTKNRVFRALSLDYFSNWIRVDLENPPLEKIRADFELVKSNLVKFMTENYKPKQPSS